MTLSTQPYKGARDFYPEDKRLQQWLFSKWRKVCVRYGYEEYDAPIIEPVDLYLMKTSEEIVTEQTYVFEDRGGRTVTLRPEMTPTVSRMVAGRRQELPYPLRWFSIPNVWRYERPQKGRLREHWQLNVDVFGLDDIQAEREIISLARDILKECGAKPAMYQIKLNSRVFIEWLLGEHFKFDQVETQTIVRLIDRMHKLDPAEFQAKIEATISPTQRDEGVAGQLIELLATKRIDLLPAEFKDHEALIKLQSLLDVLSEDGVSNAVFDLSLMRGFDYYTDIVFEVFDTHPDNNRSMFGGGRYDGLVGQFGVAPVPTVGFGMGDVTFADFLTAHDLLPKLTTSTELYVVLLADNKQARKAIATLREEDMNVAVGDSSKKIDKQLKAATKLGIEHALFVGEDELKEGIYTLKNLISGDEKKMSIERIIAMLKAQNS